MAAIGSIRKHGVALMIIIGLAMLAFILGDLSQVTRTFSNKNTLARIGNTKLDNVYGKQYEENTALIRLIQNKSSFDENETYQIHDMTWRQLLQDQILDKQLDKLGLAYNDQMVEDFKADMLASLNSQQPNQFMMQFAQALAQQVGPENAMAIISNIDEYANNDQTRDIYNAYQAIVRFALSAEKANRYGALVQNSIYFSDPLAKKLAADNKSAMVSLMPVNPQSPAFNSITPSVSDKEIKDFYNTHKKDLFTVTEPNRDIDVAIFPINPTTEDLQALEQQVRADFQQFANSDLLAYSTEKGNGSVDSTYYKTEDINLDILDSLIFKSSVGSFIEPFVYENQKWYFGKVYGGAARPDSVLVAAVELPIKNAQNTGAKYSKKEARLLADSLKNVLLSNQANIFQLRKDFSANTAGDSTFWIPERGTITTLYNGLLETPNGGIYVYKAPTGYIVFQALTRTAPIEKRQFVLYDYDILASEATLNKIKSEANAFAASVNNADELLSTAAKKGVQVVQGNNILSMASVINQLPNCRDIVSWAFSDDVKKNDISDVYNVERMFFAVAALRNVRDNGAQKFNDVKDDVKSMLETQVKAEMVADQVNKALSSSNMQALAQQYGTQVMDSVYLSFTGDVYQNRNVDGQAIAKIFALPTNKPTAVNGQNMVYVVNVDQTNTATATPGYAMEKNLLRNQLLGRERNEMTIINYLISQAKVLDNRGRFYQK